MYSSKYRYNKRSTKKKIFIRATSTILEEINHYEAEIIKLPFKKKEYADYLSKLKDYYEKLIYPLYNEKDELIKNNNNYKTILFGLYKTATLLADTQYKVKRIDEKVSKLIQDINNELPKVLDVRDTESYYRSKMTSLNFELSYAIERDLKNQKKIAERARVAAVDKKTREFASSIKYKLRTDHLCPYCFSSLGDSPCADHIYPVSKGGHSTIENMVMVCYSCNSKKSNLTLNSFIKKFNLNKPNIETELDMLGKEY